MDSDFEVFDVSKSYDGAVGQRISGDLIGTFDRAGLEGDCRGVEDEASARAVEVERLRASMSTLMKTSE